MNSKKNKFNRVGNIPTEILSFHDHVKN